ncbi:hypothetical protein TWF694_006297 [Orbilia ellipsospora]|uniref:Uncharacterized protein n=1 Tax=Orbilia ellipsospora TaxID=2528407 RepID=A0AAV9XK39_9PEZI
MATAPFNMASSLPKAPLSEIEPTTQEPSPAIYRLKVGLMGKTGTELNVVAKDLFTQIRSRRTSMTPVFEKSPQNLKRKPEDHKVSSSSDMGIIETGEVEIRGVVQSEAAPTPARRSSLPGLSHHGGKSGATLELLAAEAERLLADGHSPSPAEATGTERSSSSVGPSPTRGKTRETLRLIKKSTKEPAVRKRGRPRKEDKATSEQTSSVQNVASSPPEIRLIPATLVDAKGRKLPRRGSSFPTRRPPRSPLHTHLQTPSIMPPPDPQPALPPVLNAVPAPGPSNFAPYRTLPTRIDSFWDFFDEPPTGREDDLSRIDFEKMLGTELEPIDLTMDEYSSQQFSAATDAQHQNQSSNVKDTIELSHSANLPDQPMTTPEKSPTDDLTSQSYMTTEEFFEEMEANWKNALDPDYIPQTFPFEGELRGPEWLLNPETTAKGRKFLLGCIEEINRMDPLIGGDGPASAGARRVQGDVIFDNIPNRKRKDGHPNCPSGGDCPHEIQYELEDRFGIHPALPNLYAREGEVYRPGLKQSKQPEHGITINLPQLDIERIIFGDVDGEEDVELNLEDWLNPSLWKDPQEEDTAPKHTDNAEKQENVHSKKRKAKEQEQPGTEAGRRLSVEDVFSINSGKRLRTD